MAKPAIYGEGEDPNTPKYNLANVPTPPPSANDSDPTHGALPEYANSGYQIPGAQLPSTRNRDRVGNAYNSQLKNAKSYLANMKANSDRAYQTYANESRRKLASSIKGVKNDFNSRGLLGSGLQADRVAGTTSAANMDLVNKRAEINQGLLGNLGQLEGNVFNTGNILAQPGPDTANPYLSGVGSDIAAQSANSELAAAMYGDIAKGGGAVAGMGLSNLMQSGGSANGYDPKQRYNFNKSIAGVA